MLTEQLKNSSSLSAFEHCSVSNGQSGGLDDDCGLQKAHQAAPQLFLQCCSVGPLLRSCFSEERADCTTCSEDSDPVWHGQPSQCASPSWHMQMEQTAESSSKTKEGGLLLPRKAVDWVHLAFWDGVECLFDYGIWGGWEGWGVPLSQTDEVLWLLQSAFCLCWDPLHHADSHVSAVSLFERGE